MDLGSTEAVGPGPGVIAKAVIEAVARKRNLWPRNVNYASDAGHPCERYLYLSRVAWNSKALHDVGLEFIFSRGRYAEKAIDDELALAGLEVIEHQRPFEWREIELRGRIDRVLRFNGKRYPLEYKVISPFDWQKIDSVEDMFKSDRHWVRGWPAQLILYLMMSELDTGIFYLKNALSWQPKDIWMRLWDYLDYGEAILKKLERVNDAVRNKRMPGVLEGEPETCLACGFRHVCLDELQLGLPSDTLESPELEALIDEYFRTREASHRHKEVGNALKEALQGRNNVICGKYLLTGKWISRKAYTASYPATRYWKWDARKIA